MSDGNGNIIQCNKATRDLIASQNGAAVSTDALKKAQDTASKSGSAFAGVMKTLKGALINFGIMMAVTGLIELGKYLWTLVPTVEHLNEHLDETHQELTDITSDLDSVNNELQTTQDRITELKAQGTLTFTEEAELVRLQRENAELERKHDLLIANQKAKGDEVIDDFADSFGSEYGENSEYYTTGRKTWWNKLIDDVIAPALNPSFDAPDTFSGQFYTDNLFAQLADATEEDADRYKGQLNDVYADYSDYLKKLEDTNYQYGTNEQIDAYIDQINKFNDKYLVAFGNTENLFAQIVSRDKFADGYAAIKELGNVTQETLSQLYNENEKVRELINYLMGLGTVDWKAILGDDKFTELDTNADGTLTTLELFDQTTGECKVTSEQFSQAMSGVANELNKVEDAAEGVESSFKSLAKTLSDGLNKLSDKKDILSEVKEQLDSFGAISADNISKILEQFSDNDEVQKTVAYYLSGIGTAQQVFDAISKGYQDSLEVQAQTLTLQMQNDENYFKSLAKLHGNFAHFKAGNYEIDIANEKSLAEAKLKIENKLIETLAENWSQLYEIQGKNLAELERYAREQVVNAPGSIERRLAQDFLSDVLAQKDLYNNAINEFNDLSLEGISGLYESLNTNFDKSGKTAAEKYFDELKYKLETNQITQEQYLKELDSAYKRFYSNTTEYLEEYAKYSQEVYEGFKDMYKEDLDAQKDSLEKQKDALRDFYDERKKLLEEANEEEDYEKDKSEKLQEINELKILIAKLRTVGTQNAQKRIAELEEELSKAQEDYDEFEKEHILEKALENIEKEYETQEKKIQSQIDSVQDKLDKIDEDTLSVRDAIIDFAAKYGVNLDFAYGNSPTGIPTDKPNNTANNKDIAVGSTIVVKDTATRFSNKSNNVKMKSYVPGGTYEVLKISGDEVRIGRDGVATGWINKSDIVGYASGTYSAIGGMSRINETGLEMIAAPDGNGNYVNLLPKSKVFTAKATKFLWDLATKQQLPQAMYNSIAKTISARTGLPNVSVSQPITIQMGDIIVEGNADDKTLQLIKKAQEGMTRKVLEDIKKLQNKK